jgi:hypothetical protein
MSEENVEVVRRTIEIAEEGVQIQESLPLLARPLDPIASSFPPTIWQR